MENNLDLLTKKLYAEGVEKARVEAEALLSGARAQAEKLVADAMQEAAEIRKRAEQDAAALAKKSETELEASARMAVDALKQEITGLVAGRVADGMARQVMEDRKFVQGMVLEIVKRWDVSSGGLDLAVVLSDREKETSSACFGSIRSSRSRWLTRTVSPLCRFSSVSPSRFILRTVLSLALYSCSCIFSILRHPLLSPPDKLAIFFFHLTPTIQSTCFFSRKCCRTTSHERVKDQFLGQCRKLDQP